MVYNISGTLVLYNEEAKNDVLTSLVTKFSEYFRQNGIPFLPFEGHLFRSTTLLEGECFMDFLRRH